MEEIPKVLLFNFKFKFKKLIFLFWSKITNPDYSIHYSID
jgi:hypothetical protein